MFELIPSRDGQRGGQLQGSPRGRFLEDVVRNRRMLVFMTSALANVLLKVRRLHTASSEQWTTLTGLPTSGFPAVYVTVWKLNGFRVVSLVAEAPSLSAVSVLMVVLAGVRGLRCELCADNEEKEPKPRGGKVPVKGESASMFWTLPPMGPALVCSSSSGRGDGVRGGIGIGPGGGMVASNGELD